MTRYFPLVMIYLESKLSTRYWQSLSRIKFLLINKNEALDFATPISILLINVCPGKISSYGSKVRMPSNSLINFTMLWTLTRSRKLYARNASPELTVRSILQSKILWLVVKLRNCDKFFTTPIYQNYMLYFYALIPVNWMRAVSNFNYMYYQHCIKLN